MSRKLLADRVNRMENLQGHDPEKLKITLGKNPSEKERKCFVRDLTRAIVACARAERERGCEKNEEG